jgi:hypothetical protein
VECRLRERRSERGIGFVTRPGPRPFNPRPVPDGPAPMQIDAIQTSSSKPARLTPEERARRFKENLCLYSGAAGHTVADCPNKKPGNGRSRQ